MVSSRTRYPDRSGWRVSADTPRLRSDWKTVEKALFSPLLFYPRKRERSDHIA